MDAAELEDATTSLDLPLLEERWVSLSERESCPGHSLAAGGRDVRSRRDAYVVWSEVARTM
jgi:hypothetical protein